MSAFSPFVFLLSSKKQNWFMCPHHNHLCLLQVLHSNHLYIQRDKKMCLSLVQGEPGEKHQEEQLLHCFSLISSRYWGEHLIWCCMAVHKQIAFLIKLAACMQACIENNFYIFFVHYTQQHNTFFLDFTHVLPIYHPQVTTLSSEGAIFKCLAVGR